MNLKSSIKIYILFISYYYFFRLGYTLKKIKPIYSKNSYKKALIIAETVFGNIHLNVAQVHLELGKVCRRLGEFKEAWLHLGNALVIYETLLPNSPQLSSVATSLGSLAWEMLDYQKALRYYKKALVIDRHIHGDKAHSDIARDLNNIGMVERDMYNDKEALRRFNQAERMYIIAFSPTHENVARVAINKVDVCLRLGKIKEASQYAYFALNVYEKFYFEDKERIANCYDAIGLVLNAKGEYSKAIDYFSRAYRIYFNIYGESSVHVANSYFMSGVAYNEMGKPMISKGECCKALKIYKNIIKKNGGCADKNPNVIMMLEYIKNLNNNGDN